MGAAAGGGAVTWFSLTELTRSETALRRGIDNTPKADDLRRLLRLRGVLLDPLREDVGPLIVTSGFRSVELNTLVGGVADSAHRYGCAADLVPVQVSVEAAWLAAKRLGLPYDQCIWERRGKSEWLHIAIERPGENPRSMHFKDWR